MQRPALPPRIADRDSGCSATPGNSNLIATDRAKRRSSATLISAIAPRPMIGPSTYRSPTASSSELVVIRPPFPVDDQSIPICPFVRGHPVSRALHRLHALCDSSSVLEVLVCLSGFVSSWGLWVPMSCGLGRHPGWTK